MEEILYSLNIVAPFFLLGVFGFLVKRLGIIDDHFIDKGLSLSFKLIFPIMLFLKIYTADIVDGFDGKTFVVGLVFTLIMMIASMGLGVLCSKDPAKRGPIANGMLISNFVVIGLPVMESMYGPAASVNIAALTPVLVPLSNVFTVLAYNLLSGNRSGQRLSLKTLLMNIIRNPFIIAVILALVMRMLPFALPEIAVSGLSSISSMATPFALITVGGMLNLSEIRENLKDALVTCGFRLVIFPVLAVLGALLLGFRGENLMTILLLIGAPTAVSGAAFAKNMGGDQKLAGEITMMTMLLFTVTMFFFICGLKALALI